VNVETLRYYERRGLLPAPDRAPSGHRRYDEETVRFLGAIKEAQAVGFTLAEIAEYLRAARSSTAPSEALRVRMAAKIDQIDGRIAALQRMRDELARVVGCACTSLDHCTCGAAYLARRGGAPTSRPSLLHVTNGESAGNTLRQTGLGGAVLPWQDVLHEGPVPALTRRELLRTRARFLAGCGWGREQALLSSFERRDRQLLEALRDDLQVVLWFEHDLYDQLQLLDALALAHTQKVAPELIVIGSFPGRPSFAGLGELTASELETLWPSRGRATPAALEAATSAWAGFQAPEPTAFAEWATRDAAQLPFLAPALRRLLEELPAPADGLSGTERRALHAVAAGAHSPPAAFVAAQGLEEAPFLGDAWFYRGLAALGQGATRLLETDDGKPLPPPPPLSDSQHFARLQLRLTATGEQTLRGEADRVELLGIDRWIGGTHVTPDNLWRWDAAQMKLLR
jgi:DNA-binding transcriptional MerR regulator